MSSTSNKIRRSDVNSGGSQQPSSASYKLTTMVGSDGGNLLSGTTYFNFSGFSNLISHPSSIQNLSAVSASTTGQILLTWTAPSAYGSSGTASGYRVSTSSFPILTESDFVRVSVSTQAWVPRPPTSSESHTTGSGLTYNTTYYFNLKANDAAGNTAYVSNAAGASTLTAAVTGAQFYNVVLTSITVNWVPIVVPQGSEGYELDASTSSDFGTIVASSITTDVTLSTLAVSGLNTGTTYYFRVGGLNWNQIANFVTVGSTETLIGSAPTAVSITNVYVSSLTAVWTDAPNALGYDVEASSTGFSGFGIIYSSVTSNALATSLTVGTSPALLPNTTYFVRVGALFSGATSYSAPLLSTSTLTSPLVGVQYFNVSYTSMTVNWQALAAPPGSEGYELDLSTSPTFVPLTTSSSTANVLLSTLTLTNLTVGTTYYARVGGINWNNVVNYTVLNSTLTSSIGCAMITSQGSGAWSALSTWDLGGTPSSCNPVTIALGTTVTVDISSATASTTTINGQLSFSRIASSTLTVVGGNLSVHAGGTLDMGTSASPITGTSATLLLAYGSSAGQYGLTLNDGSVFTSFGANKWPYGFATSASGASVTISASSATAWTVGDVLTIGQTDLSTTNQTEVRTISAISGGNPLTLTLSSALSYAHHSTGTIVVGDLTRNVVIRSSGTTAGTLAYVHSLATNTTGFMSVNTEFAFLGANLSGEYGVTLDGTGGGLTLSSSTLHDGYQGLSLANSTTSTLSWNLFHGNAVDGVYSGSSNATTLTANVASANGSNGIELSTGTSQSLSSNFVYSNNSSGGKAGVLLWSASHDTLIGNNASANAKTGIDAENTNNDVLFSSNTLTLNNGSGLLVSGSSITASYNTASGQPTSGLYFNTVSLGNIIGNVTTNNTVGLSLYFSTFTLVSGNQSNAESTALDVNTSSNCFITVNQANGTAGGNLMMNNGAKNVVYNNRFIDGNMQVFASPNNLFVGNTLAGSSSGNNLTGLEVENADNNVFLNNIMYWNGNREFYSGTSLGTIFAGGTWGYDANGNSKPDAPAEVIYNVASPTTMALRGVKVNPLTPLLDLSNSSWAAGSSIISYNQTFATGTIRVYGDYVVSGSTLTLDYANALYPSTATLPIVLQGTEPSSNFTINSTSDLYAVTQALFIQYSAGQWVVTGSSTSGTLCTVAPGTSANCPSGNAQFNLSVGNAAAASGDKAVFGLLAGSQDTNVKKVLLMGSSPSSNSTWNNNDTRSRLRIDSTGAFHAVGTASSPSVITELNSAATVYYTFVDSGAFTIQYASMTDMDENGIQLSGSGPFWINNSTVDYAGSGYSSTSTLFTLNGVTNSTITLNAVTYGNSSPNGSNYNYTVTGSSVGLLWTNQNFSGALTGDAHEANDTSNHVVWTNTPSYYWIAGTSSNWNNPLNWSANSGGPSGVGVPTTGSAVFFDGNGLGNCAIDVSVTVTSMTISTATAGSYTGSVDTSSNPINVSALTLNNGTLFARTSSVTISKAWSDFGQFNAGSSTVTFAPTTGSTVTVGGSATFYVLQDVTPNSGILFQSGSTITVTALFRLSGSSGNRVNVRSSTPGVQAYLSDLGSNAIMFADVQDNNASGGTTISANDNTSVDRGDNTNWNFGSSRYWVSSVSSDWNSSANWSTVSGGPGGASIPSTGQSAIFDQNGQGNCFIDIAVTVSTLTVSTSTTGGYLGMIDTSSNTINVSSFTLNSGTFFARTSSITVSGAWTSFGTFNAGSSSVTFTGATGSTVTLTGSTSFYTLIDTTPNTVLQFQSGSTTTIKSLLLLSGASGNDLTVLSSHAGISAYVNDVGTNTVSFVNARDNNASSGQTIQAGQTSINSGNNVNWNFAQINACQTVVSVQSSGWSLVGTWNTGFVPTACNPVTITTGTVVTVDTLTASASTTTINGQLSFSRSVNSTLTMVAGTLNVNAGGLLDLGTFASPITGLNATLVLASGSSAGQYGLELADGSIFTSYGANKWPYGLASSASGTNATIVASSATAWSVGDTITIGQTNADPADETETRTITSITGGNPLTLSWITALSFTHQSTSTLVITNLTRNVVVRSSGTSADQSGYIHSLATNTTSFLAVNSEFVNMGADTPSRYGLTFDGVGGGLTMSSSTVHDGYDGVYLSTASTSTLSWSVFQNENQEGFYAEESSNTFLLNNVASSNGDMGIDINGGTNVALFGNWVYSDLNAGYAGATLLGTVNFSIVSNHFFCNADDGLDVVTTAIGGTVSSNTATQNQEYGLYIGDMITNAVVAWNTVAYNLDEGVLLLDNDHSLFAHNTIFGNSSLGLEMSGGVSNLVLSNTAQGNGFADGTGELEVHDGSVGNLVAANMANGLSLGSGIIVVGGSNNVLISNTVFGNGDRGLWTDNSIGTVMAGGTLGYDASGASSPDTPNEVIFNHITTATSVMMRGVNVNPSSNFINANDLILPSSSLVSFDQRFATGTVQVYGDYQISGSTLTLDYANSLYASSSTLPIVLQGNESPSNVIVNATVDAYAVNQVITLQYNGSAWVVSGSAAGGTLCTLVSGTTANCPASNSQFNLTIGNASASVGDSIVFGLLAASNDANVQKQLLISSAAASGSLWNNNSGRSRIEIDSTGGFHAVGTILQPTVITSLSGSGTYYTFIDSGAFTVQYASITAMDEQGIQLSGSGPFSINHSTFDRVGSGLSPISTLLTLNGVVNSTITLNDVTYGNSQVNTQNYNYTVLGSSTGLYWTNKNYSGVLAGDSYEQNDSANLIVWGATVAPTTPQLTAVYVSSLTVTFGPISYSQGYTVAASTQAWPNSDSGNQSVSTTNSQATTLSFTTGQLLSNTTYFVHVGNIEGGTTAYTNTVPSSTSTLTAPITGAQFLQVFITSVSVDWTALPAPPGSEGYTLDASTSATFDSVLASSTTANVSRSTLTVSGLSANTQYYFRVGGINWAQTVNYVTVGSTITAAGTGVTNATLLNVAVSSITVGWTLSTILTTGYDVEASSTNFASGVIYSSVTADSSQTSLAVGTQVPLPSNTTYYIRVGALFNGATAYTYTSPASTSTLTVPIVGESIGAVGPAAITAEWPALSSSEGYRLQASSTNFNGSGVVYSSVTFDTTFSTLTVLNLVPQTTYYLRVGGLNWDGLSNDVYIGSTVTAPVPPPASFSGIVQGVSSITWTWSLGAADTYTLYVASAPTVVVRSGIIGSSTTETGLSINTAYGRVLSAELNGVNSALSNSATFYTFAATPGLLAVSVVSYTSFTVTWATNSNPSYTSYEVSESTDVTFATAVSTPVIFASDFIQSVFTLQGLVPATTYYVRVRGENGDGVATPFSEIVSTRTLLTAAPANFTGVALGVSSITWSWSSVSGASYYNLYEASATATPIALNVMLSSYTETGLLTNSPYGAVVTAVTTGIESQYSIPMTVYTQAAVPGTPVFSTVGYSSFTVTWPDRGNPSSTRYQLSESPDPSFSTSISTPVPFGSLTATTTALFTLTPASTYYVRLQAENGDGIASNASVIQGTVTLLTPTPTGFAGIALGVSSISWTWSAVPGAQSYNFYDAASNTILFSTPVASIIDLGLATNTSYSREVSAVVNGKESVLTSSVTLYTFAAVPGGPLFSDVAFTSFTATWFGSGNPPSTPYEVSLSTDPAFAIAVSTPISISENFTGTTTAFVSLVQNTLYYVRERAQNGDGVFTAFSLIGSTQTLQPTTPINFQGVALGVSSISWTWNLVPGATAYNVYVGTDPSTLIQTVFTNQFIETGLATNEPYSRDVSAIVSGVESFTSTPAMVYTLAAMPTGSVLTDVELTSVAMAWSPSGNPSFTHYQARLDTQASFATAITSNTVGTAATFTGLLSNATYYTDVKAENGDGLSTPFDVTLSTITPAAVPQNGQFTLIASTAIYLSWTSSTNQSGTSYQADLSTISFVDASTDTVTTSALQAEYNDLIPDTTYYARVKALGWAGDDSAYLLIGHAITPLAAPTNLTFSDVELSSVTLVWNSFTAQKLTFDVELLQTGNFTPMTVSTSTLSAIVTGLPVNTDYSARVRVTDNLDGVSSPWSAVVSAYTLAEPPVNLSTTAVAATSVSLMWESNGNPTSTLYSVERSSDGATFFSVDTLMGTTYTDINLETGTVYLYRVRSLNGDGVPTSYAGPILVRTLGVPSVPKKPTGLWGAREAALGGSVQVTYRWRHVSERTDGSSLTNLAGYQVFASSSIFTPVNQWTQVATVPTETWSTVTTDASVQYYAIRTVDSNGQTSDVTEIMDDSVDLNHFFMDADLTTRAILPQEAANVLRLEKNSYGADLLLEWIDVPDEESGRVVRAVMLELINTATNNQVTNLAFNPPVLRAIIGYSVVNGKVVAGAPERTPSVIAKAPIIDAANAAAQLSLFVMSGPSWIKSTGEVNAADNTLTFLTSEVGQYQIRVASHAPGITLTQVYPRIITPNGDGYNDKAIFQFDNPQLSTLSGMIYDISGAKVADLKPGPIPDSTLIWDGKDGSGHVVPSGIYVYQVIVDGAPATGTVVVAR